MFEVYKKTESMKEKFSKYEETERGECCKQVEYGECKKCGKDYYIDLDSGTMMRQDDYDADFYNKRDEILNLCPDCRPKRQETIFDY